jgi:hypothetical protein
VGAKRVSPLPEAIPEPRLAERPQLLLLRQEDVVVVSAHLYAAAVAGVLVEVGVVVVGGVEAERAAGDREVGGQARC